MSFSDPTQEYLLVRPPQSLKPGTHTSHNLQIQRLIDPIPPPATETPTLKLPHTGRILPILNLKTHSLRKTRILDAEDSSTLCKFDTEPAGVLGKWQVESKSGGGWVFVGRYDRYEWLKGRTRKGEECWVLTGMSTSLTNNNNNNYNNNRRRSGLSDARTRSGSSAGESAVVGMDGLEARVVLMPPSPPMMVVHPRVVEQSVNKQEVMDVLVMGLWIVWREGVVEVSDSAGTRPGKRNSWSKGASGKGVRKRGFLDILLCRN